MTSSDRGLSSISRPLGWWLPSAEGVRSLTNAESLEQLDQTVFIVQSPEGLRATTEGGALIIHPAPGPDYWPLHDVLTPQLPESLGDPNFKNDHGLRYAYMTGAMANGIASVEIVIAMSRAGMLGSFGAAGLSVDRVSQAVDRLQSELGHRPFCVNLIHSPNEPTHEAAVADLLIRKRVTTVEASAYLDLTPAIVKYRLSGLSKNVDGGVRIGHRVIAKVSRTEVASKFLSPAPSRIVAELLQSGQITAEQAELAIRVPMCDDLTAEADSGGHTDNRPAITLLPTLLALRDRLQAKFNWPKSIRVGLAGGIATPSSVAAAFAMGAAYVVTGSINQACVESGSSDLVRKMLTEAGQADVIMAPAADMFEMGVKVQVLKRGTMFAMRGQKLFEIYRAYPSWDAVPAAEKANIEKNLLKTSFDDVWNQTREFFSRRDPSQVTKAEADPKHRMALVFRWYLGLSSRWANAGEPARQLDFQVWCGPAMGAFNEWAAGSVLEQTANRSVVAVAKNLLFGAALHGRWQRFFSCGAVATNDSVVRPRSVAELQRWFPPVG